MSNKGFVVLVGIILGALPAVHAQPRSVWSIEPAETTLRPGETVDLQLWLDVGDNIPSASSYRGLQAELFWNPSVLAATQATYHYGFWYPNLCSSPSFVIRASTFSESRALISILSSFRNPQCPMVRTPFKVFTVRFQAEAQGTSYITWGPITRLILRTDPLVVLDTDFAVVPAVIHVLPPEPEPFVWGDLSADNVSGAMDAALVLQYDTLLIDRFPAYPDIVWPDFPPAGDVSGDEVLGAVDAAAILQLDALLLDCFAADLNCDQLGPS